MIAIKSDKVAMLHPVFHGIIWHRNSWAQLAGSTWPQHLPGCSAPWPWPSRALPQVNRGGGGWVFTKGTTVRISEAISAFLPILPLHADGQTDWNELHFPAYADACFKKKIWVQIQSSTCFNSGMFTHKFIIFTLCMAFLPPPPPGSWKKCFVAIGYLNVCQREVGLVER